MIARVGEEEEEMVQRRGSPIRHVPIGQDYQQEEKRTSTGRITPHTRVALLPAEYDTLATGH